MTDPFIQIRDIWLVNRREHVGSVQFGLHPSLVVGHCPQVRQVTIVPLTSNNAAHRFPHTYEIPHSEANGLDRDSVAIVFQTMCIPYELLEGNTKIGRLEQNHYFSICTLLKKYLNL